MMKRSKLAFLYWFLPILLLVPVAVILYLVWDKVGEMLLNLVQIGMKAVLAP